MEYRDGMFQAILAEYALFEIRRAFVEHVKRSPDLPTPSDIVKLIEDDRKYRMVTEPDIETLKRYQECGIPLSAKQLEALKQSEAHHGN